MNKIFTEEDLQLIKKNAHNMTYLEMSKKVFNGRFTDKQIRTKAAKIGIHKKRQFNEDYFENIDTDTKAYLLGFIYADGCVYLNKSNGCYEFTIELNTNDRYILEKINELFENVFKITNRTRTDYICNYKKQSTRHTSRLRIYNKKICKDLIKHNILINKTYEKGFPIVDKPFFNSFLRGFFDGDGCVFVSKDDRTIISKFTNANNELLNYIKEELSKYDIDSKLYKEKDNKYNLCIYKKSDNEKFYKFLYKNKNTLYLKRKYLKFYKFFGSLV